MYVYWKNLCQYPSAVHNVLYLCISAVSLGYVIFITSSGFSVKKPWRALYLSIWKRKTKTPTPARVFAKGVSWGFRFGFGCWGLSVELRLINSGKIPSIKLIIIVITLILFFTLKITPREEGGSGGGRALFYWLYFLMQFGFRLFFKLLVRFSICFFIELCVVDDIWIYFLTSLLI